jgi:hypothetical protein
LNSNLGKITSAVEALHNSPNLPSSDFEKAEFILGYMHKNLLRTYSLTQTRIDTLLTNGRYNCVSSAVLFMILCTSFDISVSGVITKDHAFVMVHSGSQDIDVETTNIYGFNPGTRKEFSEQFSNTTGFAYVPAQNYRDRQTINKIELISLIQNNRIAEFEKQNRYAEAVPVAIDRAALLLGGTLAVNEGYSEILFSDPYDDMMDRIFNYGAALLRAGREEDCMRWAIYASPVYPDENRWQEIILAAMNNRIVKFNRAGQTSQARNFLDSNKNLISQADYFQLDIMLFDNEMLERANRINSANEGMAVAAAVEQARLDSRITEKRAAEIITFAVQKTASFLSAAPARDWRAAVNFIEEAISLYGTNRELEQSLQTYRNNIAVDYHNRFAAAWNRRNYDEAERIINEGLAEFPNNRQLLSDRETLNRNR